MYITIYIFRRKNKLCLEEGYVFKMLIDIMGERKKVESIVIKLGKSVTGCTVL